MKCKKQSNNSIVPLSSVEPGQVVVFMERQDVPYMVTDQKTKQGVTLVNLLEGTIVRGETTRECQHCRNSCLLF